MNNFLTRAIHTKEEEVKYPNWDQDRNDSHTDNAMTTTNKIIYCIDRYKYDCYNCTYKDKTITLKRNKASNFIKPTFLYLDDIAVIHTNFI